MKKGSFAGTLTTILFILIVLFVILIGGGRIIWDAGKSALSTFGLINITEVDYSQLNKDAKTSFNTLIKEINTCKNFKSNKCLCDISLSGFDEIHILEIDSSEIKLLNIKDGGRLTMDKQSIQNFNCYYENPSSVEKEDLLLIQFDEDLPRIDKSFVGVGFMAEDIRFNYNSAIYKSDKLCLISTDFDAMNIKKCIN